MYAKDFDCRKLPLELGWGSRAGNEYPKKELERPTPPAPAIPEAMESHTLQAGCVSKRLAADIPGGLATSPCVRGL